ncbi:MAG: MSHA pilin protein MshD [Kangiellaceae bacterium]|jgi:MSHA pilin protein MshD
MYMPVNKINHINKKHNNNGFTLVELVIGIVLLSVAMVTIVSVIIPQSKQGIDPLWQVRAVSLAQSLLTEISSKAFDEQSLAAGGRQACNDGTTACTSSDALGPDASESRNNFDDIDDYTNLTLIGADITNASGIILSGDIVDLFLGFEADISVVYDDNTDGINDAEPDSDSSVTVTGNKKLISIIITTPGGEKMPFSAYRSNV